MPSFLAVVVSLFVVLPPSVFAQDTLPDRLVRGVTDEVIASIRLDPDIQTGNARKAVALVEQMVLPHFDFTRMTALALGANWRKATPEQQKKLTDEFRMLLVHTYSSALSKYRDQVIDTKPLRASAGGDSVVVRSIVKQSGAESITIDYSMGRTDADWKIYDISIVGVSLVSTYRDTFTSEVRSNGVDGLIKALVRKNRELGGASGSNAQAGEAIRH
jgi:phospholipid transport system substrate-binding protein